jgi:hypothetical protein
MPPPLPPTPAPRTEAELAPPCRDGVCRCGDPAAETAPPEAPRKRFAVRVGPIDNDLWVTVDGMVLYKSRERATECFYVDLAPGEHAVAVRGHGERGVAARVAIAELGPTGPWWYDTFELDCGAGALCDREGFEQWKATIAGREGGVHEPCGSTRVKNVRWQMGRMPDMQHPEDILVELTLQIYEFATEHAPGSAECSKSKQAAEPEPEPEPAGS